MKRQTKSFEIALSAIACAIAAGALTLGSYVHAVLAGGYIIAVVALLVPLSKDFVWGAALALVGSLLLAFLSSGFFFLYLLPFAVFFGLHPIVNHLQLKYVKGPILNCVCELVKAVWFDLAMWLSWTLVLVPLFGVSEQRWYPFVEQYFFLVLFLGGTIFFAVYDCMIYFCRRSVNAAVRRIRR